MESKDPSAVELHTIAGIVSNNHVLALCDRGRENDEIVHPGARDHGVRPDNVVAYLAHGYPRLDVLKPLVDCAFARLRDGIPYDPEKLTDRAVRTFSVDDP